MNRHRLLSVTVAFSFVIACVSCAQEPPPAPERTPNTEATTWDFESMQVRMIPEGWRVDATNPGDGVALWSVMQEGAESENQVFSLASVTNTGQTYNLAIAEDSVYQDFDLTVRVRADSGEEDQGGGPIWRAIDADNYYICRYNPLEENFRVYKVIQGKRSQLETARMFVKAGEWCTIRVRMVGDLIECYLDDEWMFEVNDTTLPGPGLVGLWTKADAGTSFDDLTVAPVE